MSALRSTRAVCVHYIEYFILFESHIHPSISIFRLRCCPCSFLWGWQHQGTVLGPLLFLCNMNDLPSVVSPGTEIRLFADDCLAYRAIRSMEDQLQFKEDLTNLSNWGMQWGMRFNTSKCNIMTISNSAKPLTKFYKIDNRILQHVDVVTYLGVIINHSLDFSDHIRETVSKANKKLGFLKRNLKGSPSALKRTAYLSLIRSGLKYGATIWDPHLDTEKGDWKGPEPSHPMDMRPKTAWGMQHHPAEERPKTTNPRRTVPTAMPGTPL